MAWNGSGTFSRFESTTGCVDKAAAGTGITAILEDQRFNEFATGINTCLTKDGQNTATANLPMGGFKHTGVAVASSTTDYARADQVQNSSIIYGSTSGGAANVQTLTLAPVPSAYTAGQTIRFIAGFTNTAGTTINVNGLGAKTVKRQNGRALIGNEIITGYVYEIIYNGTDFILLNPSSEWQTWAPASYTGFSVNPVGIYRYKVHADGNEATIHVRMTTAGTSNSTEFKLDGPLTIKNTSNDAYGIRADATDNGAFTSNATVYIYANTSVIECSLSGSSTGWTNSGSKAIGFTMEVEL